MKRASRTQKKSKTKLWYVIGGVVILAAVIAGVALYYHHKNNSPAAIVTNNTGAGQNTKGAGSSGTSGSTSKGSGSSASGSTGSSSTTSTATLTAPYGNFVSDHHPNLSGSPAPNTMASVCITTPGASCTISFTNGNTTKSLPSGTANSDGSVSWNWKLQDIGLTQGTWKITATAKLGSQTKNTSDQLNLEVGP